MLAPVGIWSTRGCQFGLAGAPTPIGIGYGFGSMHITGLEQGVAALKALAEKDREYLKFLIREARSNTDLQTTFKTHDGVSYVLRLDVKTGDLVIEAHSAS